MRLHVLLSCLIPTLLAAREAAGGALLVDVTAASGLSFTHHEAPSSSWLLPATMGSGGALFDADRDGDLDVLLLDSGPPPGAPKRPGMPRSAMFWNQSTPGVLRFVEANAPPLGDLDAMGACAGDADGDGDSDVYVTGLPAGRLLRNDRGRLVPWPGNGGISDPGWGTSCAWLDADRDADLDLFVVHYVKWSVATEKACGGERAGFRSYCPPDQYSAEQDRLFAGDGKGGFADATERAGLVGERGKGLGVVAADLDGDLRTDLYVANDQTPSSLWLAREGGRFVDAALAAGVAFSDDGRAQSGMGVDAGDYDGDLDFDLTKTNFAYDTNNLYACTGLRDGRPRYREAIRAAGISQATFPMLGFATIFADLDADGDQDLFVVNGHILPNVALMRPGTTQAQENQLFENRGPAQAPVFADARARWAPASSVKGVGRGLLAGDLDSDGDLDLIVTRNGGAAQVLRNDANPRRWVGFSLQATASAPGAPGSSVVLRGPGWARLAPRRTGGSYLSWCDERVLFALDGAPAGPLTAEVRWSGGRRETFDVGASTGYVTLREGGGRAVAR